MSSLKENLVFNACYFQCDLSSLPLGQQKQRGVSSDSESGDADTGFLHTEVNRVREGVWRKFWFALEEEALSVWRVFTRYMLRLKTVRSGLSFHYSLASS